ncbi:MAG: arginyl-tRNA synthetase [Limisphaerales bacterium]|jgi:arginyl-tRNA synthetase
MYIKSLLSQRIQAAFEQLGLSGQALIQVASRPEFGDYQANGVMAAAKRAKQNPRDVAAQVVEVLDLENIASNIEIAGPGFLNITLAPAFLAKAKPAKITPAIDPQRVVVDYSAPNLAKEMHVGHLRSTIIGDCIARVHESLGHTVIRQNHVGDWGTQFGMLLTYLQDSGEDSTELADLENFYRASKQRFDEDEDFQVRARQAVVDLQSGDPDTLAHWQRFIDISMTHCQKIYSRLGVTLTAQDTAGESTYNDLLPGVVEKLTAAELLTESNGAQCVFLDEFKNKNGEPLPVIVQKSDGGYLYATTDLAAISYRTGTLDVSRAMYFVDVRQSLHFKQIFAVAAKAGFNLNDCRLEHMPFGTMLGKDGKPFKTRSGDVVKLAEVLDEAEERARVLALEKNPQLSDDAAATLARVIGIGAVKYADLSKNRTSDYVFDWDQMLSFEGNTSPYLQYAFTRIQSIFSRGEIDLDGLPEQAIAEEEPERRLAATLAGLDDCLEQVAAEAYPHYLCGYLYELATRFSHFYEACPILKSEGEQRQRRLVLAKQTGDTLALGLSLLGIGILDQM